MGRDSVAMMKDKMGDVLGDQEDFIGAQAMTIKGSRALTAWAAEAEMAEVLPNYLSQHGDVDELVVADEVIPNAFLTAVTDERVLVFSRSVGGKPKELVESYELAATTMDFVDTGDRVRSRIFVFGMPSGQVFAGECPINGKALVDADNFVASWIEAEGPSAN
jgi:hypothetical protein